VIKLAQEGLTRLYTQPWHTAIDRAMCATSLINQVVIDCTQSELQSESLWGERHTRDRTKDTS
jgi:hypothetical protein